MLSIVLLLVLAAFGLLITALTTANTLWAWVPVVVSVAAAALLVADWWRHRRVVAHPSLDDGSGDDGAGGADEFDEEVDQPEPSAGAHRASVVPLTSHSAGKFQAGPSEPDEEPAEEETDATDLLVVSGLSVPVRVVDERPRYHLPHCAWLASRPTLALPVSEARQLGFTPCALCTPDTALAAEHRAGRGARQAKP